MHFKFLLPAMLLVSAGAVLAENDPAPPAGASTTQTGAAAPAEPAAEDRMVCRTERVTGSRTRRNRTCMTQSQWDELARQTAQNVTDFNRGASGGQCVSANPTAGRC